MNAPLRARLLAEGVGTFAFFFIGFAGIAAAVNFPGSIGPAGIAAGFGLGLGLAIAAFGHISGGHFNPAVSLGVAFGRRFPMSDVIPYWIAQLLGGFVAAVAATALFTDDVTDALVNTPGTTEWRAMLIEAVAVFLFVLVIITVATDSSALWYGVLAPVAIGGFIFTAALTMGPSSGGSFNPARSLDPALWAWELGDVWIYIVGPLLGAVVAGAFSVALRQEAAATETQPADAG